MLGQRIKELGLLRAVGATGQQIFRSVLGESLAIGVMATLIALAGGIGVAAGLRAVLNALGAGLPDIPVRLTPRIVMWAAVVGVGVTMASSVFPAWRARRISPMAALTEGSSISDLDAAPRPALAALLVPGVIVGILCFFVNWKLIAPLTLLAVIFLYLGGKNIAPMVGRFAVLGFGIAMLLGSALLDGGVGQLGLLLGVGALWTIIGVVLISPLFAAQVSRLIGAPLSLFGRVGNLAKENAARSPRRTTATASALMIGLALISTVTILAESLKTSFSAVLDDAVAADWFICNQGCAGAPGTGFSAELAASIIELPEIESVLRYRFDPQAFRIEGSEDPERTEGLFSADFDTLEEHLDIDRVDGVLSRTGSNGAIGVSMIDTKIEDDGYALGDQFNVTISNGDTAVFEVTSIYADGAITGGAWFIDNADLDTWFPTLPDGFLSAITADGVEPAAARAAMNAAAEQYTAVEIRDKEEFRDTRAAQIDQTLIIVYVFLILAVLIALLGILSTLALSVFERTREIGLLRAVGTTRWQTRFMVLGEGGLVALYGGLLGVLLGVVFGAIAVWVIPDDFINTLSIPWPQLIIFVILASFAGLAASIFPAWRASRMNVLEAISFE